MNVDQLVEESRKKIFDLSRDEDLSLALMNLISLEEHAYFTAMKTGKEEYLDLLATLRGVRTDLLAKIVTEPEGEVWCMSKHLLSTSMRLIETGNKYRPQDPEGARELYENAFDMYALFWHINNKTGTKSGGASTKTAKKTRSDKTLQDAAPKRSPAKHRAQTNTGVLARARAWVREAVDCCIEK